MPSILDYLEHPEFLSQVAGMPPPQPQTPSAPPPNIMAQAPRTFGPGGAVEDGGLMPPSILSRPPLPGPGSQPEPTAAPIAMPQPTAPKNDGGIFGGMGFKPLGWGDDQAVPMPAALQPDRPPIPYLQSQATQVNNPTVNRTARNGMAPSDTPRNGMSLDDMSVENGARPIDIRSPVQRGEPDPRIQRARAFGNFMQSLGKGLTAVGAQRPGTSGAAAFAGGAGGALEGYSESERHNLDRDERGLDRKERGRERDQTFDYQNRTLSANTKYHDDLVEQHRLDREQRANSERYTPVGQDADGRIIYSDRNHPGREITGENKSVSRIGAAGQGGNTERLARIIQAEHGKDADGNYKITMEDAVRRAQSHPTDAADVLRRERMARQDLDAQEKNFRRGDTRKTLEDFRRALGLPPSPQATLSKPPVRPNEPYRSEPVVVPPALPGQPPRPTTAPAFPMPTPPLPPATRSVGPAMAPSGPTAPPTGAAPGQPVAPPIPAWAQTGKFPPGSRYSPSQNAVFTLDGRKIPAPAQ